MSRGRPAGLVQMPMISRRAALTGLAATALAGCTQIGLLAANAPTAFGRFRRIADEPYGNGPRQRLDVYVPEARAAPRPLVVFWHGGRWEFGDKGDYRFVGAALAGLGCVAVLPNYRFYPQVRLAGFMDDASRAALWASQNAAGFGADPAQLYLMGHSAGAHLAALATLDTRYLSAPGQPVPAIAGLIGLSGPYDFLPLKEPDLQDMFGPPERYADSQPIHFARPDAPRTLLVHGLGDTIVWPRNTRNLAAALSAVGVPVTVRLYPHLRHGETVGALSVLARFRAPVLADIAQFIHPAVPA
jgi:acetyl esterase/lipase